MNFFGGYCTIETSSFLYIYIYSAHGDWRLYTMPTHLPRVWLWYLISNLVWIVDGKARQCGVLAELEKASSLSPLASRWQQNWANCEVEMRQFPLLLQDSPYLNNIKATITLDTLCTHEKSSMSIKPHGLCLQLHQLALYQPLNLCILHSMVSPCDKCSVSAQTGLPSGFDPPTTPCEGTVLQNKQHRETIIEFILQVLGPKPCWVSAGDAIKSYKNTDR